MSSRIRHNLMAPLRRKTRKHAARGIEYARVGSWLMNDYFRVVRWKLLRVILSGTAHIAMKFAAMGAIFVCVKALGNDLPAAFPGSGLIAPQSPEFIVLSVGGGVLLLIASALFRYDVRAQAIRLGREYEEYSARRIIQLASRLPDEGVGPANLLATGGAMQQYPSYARYCGMTARQLTALLPTFASFVAVSCVLLWLNFWLTLTLAALALGAFIAQYPANHRTAKASYAWERTRREAGRRYAALFRRLSGDPIPLAVDGPILNDLFSSACIRGNIESFCARALGVEQAQLVSRVGASIVLGVAIVLLGIEIVEGKSTWASVAVYVAAVRFALSDFVSVCKIASNLIKHHAQIAHYREFVVGALPVLSRAKNGSTRAARWPIELDLPGLHDSSITLAAHPGDVLAVIMPSRVRARIGGLFLGVIGTREGHGLDVPVLVDSGLLAPEASLRANFGLPEEVADAAVERALAAFAPQGEGAACAEPGWLDRPVAQIGAVPEWVLAALHIVAVRWRGKSLVAMVASRFALMPDRWQTACRAALDDRVLLLLHATPTRVGQYGERAVIFCEDQSLRGWLPVDGLSSKRAFRQLMMRLTDAPLAFADLDDDELAE
jgi:hypothetical protein